MTSASFQPCVKNQTRVKILEAGTIFLYSLWHIKTTPQQMAFLKFFMHRTINFFWGNRDFNRFFDDDFSWMKILRQIFAWQKSLCWKKMKIYLGNIFVEFLGRLADRISQLVPDFFMVRLFWKKINFWAKLWISAPNNSLQTFPYS